MNWSILQLYLCTEKSKVSKLYIHHGKSRPGDCAANVARNENSMTHNES